MPEVAFVMSPCQPYPLRDLATTLGQELALQDVPFSVHLGGFPEPRPSLVYVLLDPQAYLAIEGDEALPDPGILRRTIFVCSEPVPAANEEHVALLRKAGAVFVLDRRAVVAMRRLGIAARLITRGYAKSLDRFDPTVPRPIDVLFLGTHSPRRTKYLGRAARVLARHNCVLQISERTPNANETGATPAEGRWPLLTQAKVLITIHNDEQPCFDWAGVLDAIHAGAVVVSEAAGGVAPLVAGQHLLLTSADSLPYVVEDLLSDEQRLMRVRVGAYERIKAWAPYALSVGVLRAAVVELVGEPVPSGAALGRPRAQPAITDTAVWRTASVRRSAIEPRPPQSAGTEVLDESPAWGSRRAPRVTAVVTLGDRPERVAGTLDSLARSRVRDFEVVLVDPCDVDGARHAAANWVSAHPEIASRLVVAEASGLGSAMNIGLDIARGALLLILGPGEELYPRCLGVLTKTLEAMHEIAFVYPMQEVAGVPDEFVQAGGDYVLNYLPWDPKRVCERNDIHAPALVRTDALRRVGGFTTAPRSAGFEDCDLLCHMAEWGLRGHRVAEVLVRHAQPASAPTATVRGCRNIGAVWRV